MSNFEDIRKELNEQDNLGTANPIFCVYEKERIYGIDPDYAEGDKYEMENGEKVYYIERDRFITPHFTLKAAERYIRENSHNMNKPFVYVISLNRCPEMIAIRLHLMNKQVEYKIISDDRDGNPDCEYELNDLGGRGWELCCVKEDSAGNKKWYFKR